MIDLGGDTTPENRLIAERAVPVLAGLLAFPETWERVRETLGAALAVQPSAPLRGDAWTRTAWTALAEIYAAETVPDPFVLREQLERLATHKRRGLLDGWTDADRDRVAALVPEMLLCAAPSVVIAAAERLADYCDAVDVGQAMQGDASLLLTGGLLSPIEAAARVSEKARACRPRTSGLWGNAARRAQEVFDSKAPQFVPTNILAIDKHVSGVPVKQLIGVFGRPGTGKSTVLQTLVMSMVFPKLTLPKLTLLERATVNADEGRPHILVVSAENPADMFFDRVGCCTLGIASQDMLRSREKARVDNDSRAHEGGITVADYVDRLAQYERLTVVDADDVGSTRSALLRFLNEWADHVDAQDPNAAKVIAFDYLQHVSQTKEPGDIAEIAKGFSDFARSRSVAFLLGNQCNSDAENSLPTKESSRYSKAINDLAGQIWCLHAWSPSQRETLVKLGYPRDVLDCMILRSDKGRGTKTGWSAVLSLEGQHYRITQTSNDAPNHLADKRILRAIKDGTPVELAELLMTPDGDMGFPL